MAGHLLGVGGGGFASGALAKGSSKRFCEQQEEVLVAAHLLRAAGGGFGGDALAKRRCSSATVIEENSVP